MKILGIGNAIVDVICKVDDSFIEQNDLTKSTKIGRAHVRTPVTEKSRMPSSA